MVEQWGIEFIASILFSWLGPLTVIVFIAIICAGLVISYRLYCYTINVEQQKWYHRPLRWLSMALLWVFEIACNYTILLIIFHQLPQYKRATKTLHRKAHDHSVIARWICRRLLNPKDNGLIYPANEYKI